MSKELIEQLRFDASVRVNGTAMTAADNLVKAADALEIATARINTYTKELGSCRISAGFGSADDPMAQEGFDALGDPLCVAAFVESQFKRIVAERDSLAAELKALREQINAAPVPAPKGYVLKTPKRAMRRFGEEAAAQSAAMAVARAGRTGEVFALVPVGRAVRGAEWREARKIHVD